MQYDKLVLHQFYKCLHEHCRHACVCVHIILPNKQIVVSLKCLIGFEIRFGLRLEVIFNDLKF